MLKYFYHKLRNFESDAIQYESEHFLNERGELTTLSASERILPPTPTNIERMQAAHHINEDQELEEAL